jgi:hypothetical protein
MKTCAMINKTMLLNVFSNRFRRVGRASKIDIRRTYTIETTPYFFSILILLNKMIKIPPAKTRLATFKAMPVAFIFKPI